MKVIGQTSPLLKKLTIDNTTNVIYRREDGDVGLLEVKEK